MLSLAAEVLDSLDLPGLQAVLDATRALFCPDSKVWSSVLTVGPTVGRETMVKSLESLLRLSPGRTTSGLGRQYLDNISERYQWRQAEDTMSYIGVQWGQSLMLSGCMLEQCWLRMNQASVGF